MKILDEFKKFAIKGNVTELAIAVVVGGAFGKIVTSLVNDIIMPPFGFLLGGVNFKNLSIIIKQATDNTAAITWNYGAFIQNIVDFLIIAWAIFIFVKIINKLQTKKEIKKEIKIPQQEKLLIEIRDLLKK